jgi:hypothetical protein
VMVKMNDQYTRNRPKKCRAIASQHLRRLEIGFENERHYYFIILARSAKNPSCDRKGTTKLPNPRDATSATRDATRTMLQAAMPPVDYACEVALRAIRWILALRAGVKASERLD